MNSTFQTFTWTVNAYSSGHFNLHTYPSPYGSTLTQTAGSVDMRYTQLYFKSSNAVIASSISCNSLSELYFQQPTHMPTGKLGVGTWTDNGTDATITLGNGATSQDHYKTPGTCPANGTITMSIDVKLGTATNIVLYWWAKSTIQVFDSSNGLNTSSFVTCTHTFTNTTSSAVQCEWSIGRQYNHAGSPPGWATYQTTGTCIVKNFSVKTATNIPTTTFTGDVSISGTMTAATKSFDIKHPDPDKIGHRLRHWCIESDTPGGMVMYTKSVEMSTTSGTFNMPDWLKHLTKNVIVLVTPFNHFGSGWGECLDNELQIHTTTKGQWNVLITASRADYCSQHMRPQEVDYTTIAPIVDKEKEMPK